jgi:hypothetical protein
MVDIIKEKPKKPSFINRLGTGLSQGIEQIAAQYQGMQQENQLNDKIKELTGKDVRGLAPEMKSKFMEQFGQGQLKELNYLNKLQEKNAGQRSKEVSEAQAEISDFQGALDAISKMEGLRKKGNLGMFNRVQGIYDPQAREDKGAYQTLGNSLISYASSIPIRNKQEFEKLAGHISDPNITDAEASGILQQMRTIITNSMKKHKNVLGEDIDLGAVKVPTQTGVDKPKAQAKDFWK